MKDVQAERDGRNMVVDEVGVRGLRFPVTVLDRGDELQATVAVVDMTVELPEDTRGTHMSRFVEVLNELDGPLTLERLGTMAEAVRLRLGARAASLKACFPYFMTRVAPVSAAKGRMAYDCAFQARVTEGEPSPDLLLEVRVPVTLLCPCSKEISEAGAHNQRAWVMVSLRTARFRWIEDVVALVEDRASSPVYPLLKRPDEKHVTETAFARPRFVEDMVRDVAVGLRDDDDVLWFSVSVESHESIHDHDAWAHVKRDKRSEGR